MATGGVRKRGSNWYYYYRDNNHKQVERVAPGRARKTDAEAALAGKLAELSTGTYRELKDVTFRVFATRWLEEYAPLKTKPSTLATYKSRIEGVFIPRFGDRRLSTFTARDGAKLLAELKTGGKSATTQRHYLTLLKTMFGTAVKWQHVGRNPFEDVDPPKVEHKEMRCLTAEEVRTFLAAVPEEHRALFMTATLTGMRLGELLALRWSDFDPKSNTIRISRSMYRGEVQTPKTEKSVRTVGITPMLAKVLEEGRPEDADGDALVFAGKNGGPLDPDNLRHRVFAPAIESAELKGLRIHDLRHTYASLMIDQGENLKLVQSQLGHASITTTVDRYGHLRPGLEVEAARRLDATVFGKKARKRRKPAAKRAAKKTPPDKSAA